jgi:L-glutamine-phosphate cytidylyltransferase
MRAIILAAGRGSRMKSLTDERPKCLVELRGKTLLEWQLGALRGAGINEIAIVTGYKRELLTGYGLVEFFNPRWAETNMVSSLGCAQAWLLADTCIVSYADIFYDSSAVSLLVNCAAPLAVTYDCNWLASWQERFGDPLLDAETFRLKPDDTLLEIGNKPRSIEEIDGQYMGLLRFTPASWDEVSRIRADLTDLERDTMHMTGTLQKIIDAGRMPVRAVRYDRSWGEIDSAEDLTCYEARGNAT